MVCDGRGDGLVVLFGGERWWMVDCERCWKGRAVWGEVRERESGEL